MTSYFITSVNSVSECGSINTDNFKYPNLYKWHIGKNFHLWFESLLRLYIVVSPLELETLFLSNPRSCPVVNKHYDPQLPGEACISWSSWANESPASSTTWKSKTRNSSKAAQFSYDCCSETESYIRQPEKLTQIFTFLSYRTEMNVLRAATAPPPEPYSNS